MLRISICNINLSATKYPSNYMAVADVADVADKTEGPRKFLKLANRPWLSLLPDVSTYNQLRVGNKKNYIYVHPSPSSICNFSILAATPCFICNICNICYTHVIAGKFCCR